MVPENCVHKYKDMQMTTTVADELYRQASNYDAWWRFGYHRIRALELYDKAGKAYFEAGHFRRALEAFQNAHRLGAKCFINPAITLGYMWESLIAMTSLEEHHVSEAATVFLEAINRGSA